MIPASDGSPVDRATSPVAELFLLRLRYKEGGLRDVGANKPFLLDDPSLVWVVYSGTVDIFVVPVRDGEVVGSRTHVLRREAGQAVFGFGPVIAESDLGLLAVGVAGTRVLRLKRSRLQELAGNTGQATEVATVLESWIADLSEAITDAVPPRDCVQLEPGNILTLDGPIRPKSGVLWISSVRGNANFLGSAVLTTLSPEECFPLSRQTWLQTVGEATLSAADTQTYWKQDPSWKALDRFHRAVLATLVFQRSQSLEAEAARVQAQVATDQRDMQRALGQIAAVLGDDARPALLSDRGDPLLAACRLIGQTQGATMHPPASRNQLGTLPRQVQAIARASRVRVRTVMLAGDWWRRDNGPLLGYEEATGNPIALLPRSPRRYEAIDAKTGQSRPVNADVAATLGITGWTFYRVFPDRAISIGDLFRFGLSGQRSDFLVILLMGLAAGALGVLTPVATGTLFNTIIPNGERGQLLLITLVLLLAAISTALFNVTRGVALQRMEGKRATSVQAALWDRLLNLPAPFFRQFSSGDLASRAASIDTIRQILTNATVSSLLGAIFGIFSFGMLFYFDVHLALVATLLVIILIALTMTGSYILMQERRLLLDQQSKTASIVLQLLEGIAKLRVTGAERRGFARWAEEFSLQRSISFKLRAGANRLAVLDAAYPIITTLTLFGLTAQMGGLSPGTFLAFYTAFTQFLVALLAMGAAFTSILNVIPLYEQVRPILGTLPEVRSESGDPGDLAGTLEVSHVSFRYRPEEPLVLNDVSFRIRAGESIAIVGPSGSGKSSLLRLLLAFETPETGSIYYDGKELAKLDVQAVRRQIGVVLQEAKLMPGTIFDNIIGATGLTLEDAWTAARMAGLEEDIKQMPMGMHTMVMGGGATFSGGQRQRLMIARAIVAKPRLLFFDEATSALDSITQATVSASLAQLQATRLVIAHRLSTIQTADRIFVIVGGRVVQNGTYQQLIDQPGPFANLVKRQVV